MSKKIISLLLAVMLTVSMVAVAAVSVSALTDDQGAYVPSEGTATNRLYFICHRIGTMIALQPPVFTGGQVQTPALHGPDTMLINQM